MKLTKIVQLGEYLPDHGLYLDLATHSLFFGTIICVAKLSQQGATLLAHSAGLQITYAEGTEGWKEEQDAKAELLTYGHDI